MKLASLKNGRDGTLLVVSQDLMHATRAAAIVPTLQAALDNWSVIAPKLTELYHALNRGNVSEAIPFKPEQLSAPLPRAYQWCDGSAYVNHVELVRRARGAELPESFWHDPLMYQGGSDGFLGPCDDIPLIDPASGADFESEIAVITDDVSMGTSAVKAKEHIRLLMLVNDVTLRNLIPAELAKGFGFFHSKPASAFSPVAVTPDELGDAWNGSKVSLPLRTYLNDTLFGEPDAGIDMTFDFPTLIAHAAATRVLGAGTIVGSGTVSNRDRSKGSSCIAEQRMLETIARGQPATPFLQFGDRVRIDMLDRAGQSIFGAIDQKIVPYSSRH